MQNKKRHSERNPLPQPLCPACGSEFSPSETTTLKKKGDASLVSTRCKECEQGIVMVVQSHQVNDSLYSVAADLTPTTMSVEDIRSILERPRLHPDHVIALYSLMQTEKNPLRLMKHL